MKNEKIIKCGMKRYANPLHYEFHLTMYEMATMGLVPTSVTHLGSDLLQRWKQAAEIEGMLVRRVRARIETTQRNRMQKGRNWYISRIFQTVRSAVRAPETDLVEAGELLKLTTNRYKNLQYRGVRDSTGMVRGLIHDLRKTEVVEAMQTLQLNTLLSKLEVANNRIHDLLHERAHNQAQMQLPRSAVVRPVADACWEQVVDKIHSSMSLCENEADLQAMNVLVRRMNTLIKQFQDAYVHRTGRNGAKVGGAKVAIPAETKGDAGNAGEPAEDNADSPAGSDAPSFFPGDTLGQEGCAGFSCPTDAVGGIGDGACTGTDVANGGGNGPGRMARAAAKKALADQEARAVGAFRVSGHLGPAWHSPPHKTWLGHYLKKHLRQG